MIRPPPRAIMDGATARAQRNMEVRFVARMPSHSPSVISTARRCSTMPALFTRTSMGPSASSTARTVAAISSLPVTSRRQARAALPAWRMRAAVASAWSTVRAAQATAAPASPSATAIARPIPRLAPVTSVTRPASGRSVTEHPAHSSSDQPLGLGYRGEQYTRSARPSAPA